MATTTVNDKVLQNLIQLIISDDEAGALAYFDQQGRPGGFETLILAGTMAKAQKSQKTTTPSSPTNNNRPKITISVPQDDADLIPLVLTFYIIAYGMNIEATTSNIDERYQQAFTHQIMVNKFGLVYDCIINLNQKYDTKSGNDKFITNIDTLSQFLQQKQVKLTPEDQEILTQQVLSTQESSHSQAKQGNLTVDYYYDQELIRIILKSFTDKETRIPMTKNAQHRLFCALVRLKVFVMNNAKSIAEGTIYAVLDLINRAQTLCNGAIFTQDQQNPWTRRITQLTQSKNKGELTESELKTRQNQIQESERNYNSDQANRKLTYQGCYSKMSERYTQIAGQLTLTRKTQLREKQLKQQQEKQARLTLLRQQQTESNNRLTQLRQQQARQSTHNQMGGNYL